MSLQSYIIIAIFAAVQENKMLKSLELSPYNDMNGEGLGEPLISMLKTNTNLKRLVMGCFLSFSSEEVDQIIAIAEGEGRLTSLALTEKAIDCNRPPFIGNMEVRICLRF